MSPLAPTTHGFSVFTAPAKPAVVAQPEPFGEPRASGPTTATLVYGPREAILIDALLTVGEATVLADWVTLHGRTLTTIYITHGHFDHFYGLSVLTRRFPEARAIATPEPPIFPWLSTRTGATSRTSNGCCRPGGRNRTSSLTWENATQTGSGTSGG
jgi:glyoxylase-like metal-dependent hydrolase (beta-lactamase superfamily II)